MVDIVISKHVNGKDWVAETQVGSNAHAATGGWKSKSKTKSTLLDTTLGKAQTIARRTNTTIYIDEYTGKGKLKETHGVKPQ